MKSLLASVVAVAALALSAPVFSADVSRTFTITKPASYVDGTAFGTETLVYVVYDAATNAQLFSTFNLVTTRTVPDTLKCVYARAAVYNETTNAILVGPDGKSTISDPSPNGCVPTTTTPPPVPATKKVGAPTVTVK